MKQHQPWAIAWKKKFVEPNDLKVWAEGIRSRGQSIVTTNGSFDLVHAGHLHTLFEAKALGDIFIVLLNTDASIRGYKGRLRPIIEEKYRLQMMAAFECVDYVSCFDELDPRRALEEIAPAIHVNSAEYGVDCIERAVVEKGGGRVVLIEKIDSLSTSAVISRIETCILSQA